MTDSRKEEKGFELVSKFQPQGDQISAIQELVEGIKKEKRHRFY